MDDAGSGQGITVRVEYFAVFRACASMSGEEMILENDSPALLYEILRRKCRFPLERGYVHLSVNDVYAKWDSRLAEGDTVIFIPPVAGG